MAAATSLGKRVSERLVKLLKTCQRKVEVDCLLGIVRHIKIVAAFLAAEADGMSGASLSSSTV